MTQEFGVAEPLLPTAWHDQGAGECSAWPVPSSDSSADRLCADRGRHQLLSRAATAARQHRSRLLSDCHPLLGLNRRPTGLR